MSIYRRPTSRSERADVSHSGRKVTTIMKNENAAKARDWRKKLTGRTAVSVAVSMLIAGCGGGSVDDDERAAQAPTSTSTSTDATAAKPAAAAVPRAPRPSATTQARLAALTPTWITIAVEWESFCPWRRSCRTTPDDESKAFSEDARPPPFEGDRLAAAAVGADRIDHLLRRRQPRVGVRDHERAVICAVICRRGGSDDFRGMNPCISRC
jgi:hypothetical protein